MPRVTPRTRFLVLGLFGAAWFLLGLVNLWRGRTGIGVAYSVVGLELCAAAWFTSSRDRSRGPL